MRMIEIELENEVRVKGMTSALSESGCQKLMMKHVSLSKFVAGVDIVIATARKSLNFAITQNIEKKTKVKTKKCPKKKGPEEAKDDEVQESGWLHFGHKFCAEALENAVGYFLSPLMPRRTEQATEEPPGMSEPRQNLGIFLLCMETKSFGYWFSLDNSEDISFCRKCKA
ncbi:hypothetical protein RUM44_000550 [Polyplax serrata]|uniref:Uncharacterized protein n=1 Tax=Polyplax serrata TaxID=468196 RepID=A0ABR1B5S9_POLSC